MRTDSRESMYFLLELLDNRRDGGPGKQMSLLADLFIWGGREFHICKMEHSPPICSRLTLEIKDNGQNPISAQTYAGHTPSSSSGGVTATQEI